MRRGDIPDGLRLVEAAGWNQTAADWEFFLEHSPDGCRVAESDAGTVVATVATIRFGQGFGWVAMVLVDPLHRGAGIGSRMLNEALGILSDMSTVRLDATPEGRRVYVPLGFRDEYALQRMICSERRCRAPASSNRVEPMTDTHFDRVVAVDRSLVGVDRRALLALLRREAPEYARVLPDASGNVRAYTFGRHGRSYEHIGPLGATDDHSARAVLEASLAMDRTRPLILDVPARPSWVDWLESSGFTTLRPFTRMYRGTKYTAERLEGIFAVAGPEFA